MTQQPSARSRPILIELVGPAGVGKTTLLRALVAQDPTISDRLTPGSGQLIRCLLGTAPLLTTISARHYRGGRWFSWGEIRSMLYLQAWQQNLHALDATHAALVFDHGPIYRLAWLSEFGPELVRCSAYRAWWRRRLRQWATTLDWVIWLEAPTDVLIERIRSRSQPHLVKEGSSRRASRFLARYDKTYRRIIDEMSLDGDGPQVLRADTRRQPAEQLAADLLTTIRRPPSPRRG